MTPVRISAWIALAAACAAPWAFGAAMPLHSMLLAAVCLAAVALAMASTVVTGWGGGPAPAERRALLLVPLAAAVGLVPVPPAVFRALVPGGAEVLERIGAADEGWRPLSLMPSATAHSLALAAAAAGTAWLVVRAASGPRTRRAMLAMLAALGAALAAQGVWQHLHQSDPPRIYGTVEIYETTTPFGPYVNRNHFGGVMALLFGCTAGLTMGLVSERRHVAAGAAALAAAAQMGALAMTTSRGAFLAAAAGIAFLAATPFLGAGRIPVGRVVRTGAVVVLAVAAVAGLVMLLGGSGGSRLFNLYGRWTNRFGVQADALQGFADNPLFGTGAGTFADVYPSWQRINDIRSFSNAHSDWAQFLMETGLLGAAAIGACLIAVAAGVRRAAGRGPRLRWEAAGAAAGTAAVCVHGFFEVNLHLPANALLTAVAASLACAPAAEAPGTGDAREAPAEDRAA